MRHAADMGVLISFGKLYEWRLRRIMERPGLFPAYARLQLNPTKSACADFHTPPRAEAGRFALRAPATGFHSKSYGA